MATIVLIRHGTTAETGTRLYGRSPGVHLDDAGRGQAAAVADRLADVGIEAVYASPLERTTETAEALAERLGLEVRVLEGVLEVDYGSWMNRTLKQLRRRKLWKTVQRAPSRVTFPDGESLRRVQSRAVDAIEGLAEEHGDATVAVVSHADVIKTLVAHYVAMPLDAFQRLYVAPASVTVLRLPDGGLPMLLRFNDTGDLARPGPA